MSQPLYPPRSWTPSWWLELRQLLGIATPIIGAQFAMMLLNVVDTMMVGHIGVEQMAAAALATQWANTTTMFGVGVVSGIDPLISQASGAKDGEEVGRALHQGIWVALLVSVPIGAVWLLLEPFLLMWGQPPNLARAAQAYLNVQLPGLPFVLLTIALRSYLQNRSITIPGLVVMVGANVLNLALNSVFIFGIGHFEGWGLTGAGIATSSSRIAIAIALWLWIRRAGLYRGFWVALDRSSLSWRRTRRTLSLGVPIGLTFLTEVLAFSGSAFIAAKVSPVAISAHAIVLNLTALNFMIPLGLAMGTAARVGQHIGRKDFSAMRLTARYALVTGAVCMSGLALLLMLARTVIPKLYTDSVDVLALAAAVFPIVAAFQLADGTQVIAAGVLRGMGRTRFAMGANLLGYYVVGLPLGVWLTFYRGLGLPGIWWGLFAGLFLVAGVLLLWVYRVRHQPLAMLDEAAG